MDADSQIRVLVVHRGSRDHYLAARALFRRGCLAGVLTDVQAPKTSRLAGWMARSRFASLRRWAAAKTDDIPTSLLFSLGKAGVLARAVSALMAKAGHAYRGYELSDGIFARATARVQLPAHDVVFAYSYAALELLEVEKQRGVFTVLNQIDPGPADQVLLEHEELRWPDYVLHPYRLPRGYVDRVKREWQLADVIVVNSDWSRSQIISAGAEPRKIEVVSLAYETDSQRAEGRGQRAGSKEQGAQALKVLWVGNVNIRKGIQYVVEAARTLQNQPVEFVVAGEIGVPKKIVDSSPGNMRWLGPVPRSDVQRLYQDADVFVLPTLSDGFAITQLEALANGVPVIATPNCGRVVEDDKSGFVIPHGDADALVSAIESFICDRSLRQRMSEACRERASKFSLAAYAEYLLGAIESRLRCASRDDPAPRSAT
jgi:glycosyltransferase involved in cell wall biosynthesis